jgi:predicted phage baseplate assembly protein
VEERKKVQIPYAAVTAADFEYVATATPGLRVARAKAVVVSENKVAVAVVPYSPLEKPLPSDGFKKTVCEHIDMHRLLTTSIQVRGPDYVRVSISAELTIMSGSNQELVRDRIMVALDKFLSPIEREPGDNAWPFGRAVYRSEVYEVIEGVEGVDCVAELYLRGEEGSFRYMEGNIMIGPLSLVYPGRHSIEIIEQTTVCKRGDYEQG